MVGAGKLAVIQQNLLVNHRAEPLVFHVVYDDDSPRENRNDPPALPEPEKRPLIEDEPVQAKPEEEVSRRRDDNNHGEGVVDYVEEPETIAQRQRKNLLTFLSEDDGFGS